MAARNQNTITMRCNNCGYVNENSVTRCIKCDAPLDGGEDRIGATAACDTVESEGFQPGATVSETTSGGLRGRIFGAAISSIGRRRPEPSHAVNKGDGGTVAPVAKVYDGEQGTINPWIQRRMEGKCRLQMLESETSVDCESEQLELTRDMLNSADHTISSHQALLTHEADGWYIEDCSTYHTTSVIASRKIRLEEGDIVIFGASRFRFTTKSPEASA